MQIYRLFVEKKEGFDVAAKKIGADIRDVLGINAAKVRLLLRYDIEGLIYSDYQSAVETVFSEPPCDRVYEENADLSGYLVFATEYLPGQYDQRADSAEQCVALLTRGAKPKVKCATVYAISGVNESELNTIKNYIINPVEAREASLQKPEKLSVNIIAAEPVPVLYGFTSMTDEAAERYHAENGFAMTAKDLMFVRDYFRSEKREPTETEIKVIDTYWSDHCRHTTFLTELKDVKITGSNTAVLNAYHKYMELYREINGAREDKYPCFMDIATIGGKKLKISGHLNDLDLSDEINACSINVKAEIDGKTEDWLVMFKNETHNHPTEIEPFGGAATCLGGAIRDPLSGRTYVYQAMRVTGCANPLAPISETIKGKLPQRVITKTAAAGFSSYGNQIGLATGIVAEIYHSGYAAKRLETGFVVGAAPKANVYREKPQEGDIVILLGGETGRDGCGGATGSSKAHTAASVEKCGAEVQKGNPLTERKIQRLFRNKNLTTMIKKCNDFGAGGVCVAIGELADALEIDLSAVPKKYSGLSGTELAISESQERMAVVISKKDADKFIAAAAEENLAATVVARITSNGRLVMKHDGRVIVDISRKFLDTNGVKQTASAHVCEDKTDFIFRPEQDTAKLIEAGKYSEAALLELKKLNVCSQKGLSEIFDSTIGAASVYMPFGGKNQITPAIAMAAKLPTMGKTEDCTVSSYACYPLLSSVSPFAGSVYAIVSSVAKLVASGADRKKIRLTLQEFFKRLKGDPLRWGQPLSALLGALSAQLGLFCGAIGGKDSMSGTFENLDVPPTLISFALSHEKADRLITNVIEGVGTELYAADMQYDENNLPDFDYLCRLYDKIHENILSKNTTFATVCENGGIISAVVKSCLGNGYGFNFDSAEGMFSPLYGTILLSAKDISAYKGLNLRKIGKSAEGGIFNICGKTFTVAEAAAAYCGTLEKVFKTTAPSDGECRDITYCKKPLIRTGAKFASPKVFIPVFPGTNCEYDTARKFTEAGAEVVTYVIKNRTSQEIEQSAREIAKLISQSQIIAFPGGFSGGDEPDGSGKFIATTFRNPHISDEVLKLLKEREGLILGICNGFQALIKLGLVPYGEIIPQKADSPTLTFNTISRHVSTLADIRVCSDKSPWFDSVKCGEIFTVPVSHGEGRFICTPQEFETLAANGQIATQYADGNGHATMEPPFNPNGSYMAVEGITSPCGRVLGKMGHSERTGSNLYKNCGGNFDMKIFQSGVKYFK